MGTAYAVLMQGLQTSVSQVPRMAKAVENRAIIREGGGRGVQVGREPQSASAHRKEQGAKRGEEQDGKEL